MAVKLMGAKVNEHIAHNAAVVEKAYLDAVGDMGSVVNAAFDSPSSEFSDPAHVNQAGRRRLGAAIADAVRPFLDEAAT
jgi:lysophospholipase L1-like esterase